MHEVGTSAARLAYTSSMLRILIVLTTFALAFAHARFEWRDVVHDVTIAADGSFTVVDERTLWTDDDFGEAFICIEHGPDVRITLLPDSGAVDAGPSAEARSQACADGTAGTELVVANATRVQERRVRFTYRVDGGLEAHNDVVQFYWNLEQRSHPPILGYRATVRAPGPSAAPYDAYVMRYTNPERPRVNLSTDRSTLTIAFDRIPDGDGVEVRFLMDPALFTVAKSGNRLEAYLRDQARISGVQQRQRWLDAILTSPLWGLVPIAVVVALIVGIYRAYRAVGREPNVDAMRYPFEPPRDLPPAAVTALLQQHFNPNSMGPGWLATILDLARRGYVHLQGRDRTLTIELDPAADASDLDSFEARVLEYLQQADRTRRRGGGAMTMRDLERYGRSHAQRFLADWGPRVRKWVEGHLGGPLTSEVSRAVTRTWTLRTGASAAGFLALAALFDGTARVTMIAGGFASIVLLAVAAASLPAWRPEVAREVAGWQGFKRTLSDYTRMKDAPPDFFLMWDRYFVYAAALGVAERYLRAVERALPQRMGDAQATIRQAAWLGAADARDLASITRAARSLSSALAKSGASASSGGSSSGGGGGRSGGGSSGGR